MYADDTVIYNAAPSLSDIVSILNDELSRLNDWSLGNELFINIKKTEYVLFGTSQKLNQARTEDVNEEVCLGDKVMKRVHNYKYLVG